MNNLEGRFTQFIGDVFDGLAAIDPDSVDCVVTSPPYWGLRDYGVAGQIGLEPTLAEHLEKMVMVFEEVKRVLKPTGTLWLNYGDCFASTPNGRKANDITGDDRAFRDKPFSTIQGVLKPKDLCMIPNRLAIALQESGWWVRQENIWAKPNPMPESIRDRPANAFEKVFMLTKSPKYYYNAEAVRVRRVSKGDYKTPDGWDTGPGGHGSVHRGGREKGKIRGRSTYGRHTLGDNIPERKRGAPRPHEGFNKAWDHMSKAEQQANGRNLRNYEPAPLNVWVMATRPFKGAHFATFPPELAERCILAGCPPDGLVLDPFGGAGTTALVALRHGLRAHLIELNPEYAEIARDRIAKEWRSPVKAKSEIDMGPLFGGAGNEL